MLTGTLVTAAGFLPIATAPVGHRRIHALDLPGGDHRAAAVAGSRRWCSFPTSATGCCPTCSKPQAPKRARWRRAGTPCARALADRWLAFAGVLAPPQPHGHARSLRSALLRALPRLIDWCVRHRWMVIALTVAAFVAVDRAVPLRAAAVLPVLHAARSWWSTWSWPKASSLRATEAQAKRFEKLLATRKDLENYVAYVGTGSPRFYLPLDQQLPQANFAQFVLLHQGRGGARGHARLADQRRRAATSPTCRGA